jgi:hypothetical protein
MKSLTKLRRVRQINGYKVTFHRWCRGSAFEHQWMFAFLHNRGKTFTGVGEKKLKTAVSLAHHCTFAARQRDSLPQSEVFG